MTEKSDKELLREYGEQQKKKQADWLEATRKNYRVDRHSTPRKERTLWDPTSERLPTIEEIKDNRGWPSAENEAKLRALFLIHIVMKLHHNSKTKRVKMQQSKHWESFTVCI